MFSEPLHRRCTRSTFRALRAWTVAAALIFSATAATADDTTPAREGSTAFGVDDAARLVETGFGPAPFFTLKDEGADFFTRGSTSRAATGIPEPFGLPLPAAPGAVVKSYVQWNWLLNGPPPAADTIDVNGTVITGTLCGRGSPDLCWGKDGAAAYIAELPPGLLILPGVNTIGLATDRAVGFDPLALGEGVSILVVYRVAGDPMRSLDLYCGYTSNISGPAFGTATANYGFSNPYVGGGAHFFLNGLDTQSPVPGWEDAFFINGIAAGGAVPGTFPNNNAWQGLLGPLPINNLYDHADGTLGAPYLTPGDVGLTATTTLGPTGGDCIGHSFGAISFGIKETFPKWTQLPHPPFEGFDVASNLDWQTLSEVPPGDPGPGPNVTTADDFQSDGRPITCVRFWGSYIDPAFEPTIQDPNGVRDVRGQIGACCLPDGTCVMTTQDECLALGGTYLGDNVDCFAGICRGACCAPDGTCFLTIQSQCEAGGGTFLGPGSDCADNPCATVCAPDAAGFDCVGDCPPGFLCVPRCIEFDPDDPNYFRVVDCDCRRDGECHAEFIPGVGVECVGTCPQGFECVSEITLNPATGLPMLCCDCVEITGACCLQDGTCIVTTPSDCDANGGMYQGDNVPCNNPNPCIHPPFGACCLPDGSCVIVGPTLCDSLGGVYQGDNTTCTPNPCPDKTPEIDGWLISFHTDLPADQNPDGFSRPERLLALYFAPAEAVSLQPTSIRGCDDHTVWEYLVELEDTCLLHSYEDPRPGANPPVPGKPDAFLETAGFIYWIDIEAVVGHTYITEGGCPNCTCDVNGDGLCNTLDLSMILGCFGQPPIGACATADINCDGSIDTLDEVAWQCLVQGNPPDQCCGDTAGACIEIPTENRAFEDFWGWHTSPDAWNDVSTQSPVIMGPNMEWIYPAWTPVLPLCANMQRVDQAFELLTPEPPCPGPCPGDLAAPFGVVDVFDLFVLLNTWGPCPPPCPPNCPADLDCNCTVDVFDLFILLNNWGQCP